MTNIMDKVFGGAKTKPMDQAEFARSCDSSHWGDVLPKGSEHLVIQARTGGAKGTIARAVARDLLAQGRKVQVVYGKMGHPELWGKVVDQENIICLPEATDPFQVPPACNGDVIILDNPLNGNDTPGVLIQRFSSWKTVVVVTCSLPPSSDSIYKTVVSVGRSRDGLSLALFNNGMMTYALLPATNLSGIAEYNGCPSEEGSHCDIKLAISNIQFFKN